MAAIAIENLSRLYRQKGKADILANDSISLNIETGEIFGLLGHNGAGKSTLVMQIMGLLAPSSGSIHVAGIDVAKNPQQVKAIVGYLPQGQMPLRYVEVRHALHFAGRLKGLSDTEAKNQVNWLLGALDLETIATQYVNKLSGGLLRMTNFAMALMGKPQILILDEPTNNLDPQRRRQIWEMVQQLNAERGLTCLLVTHNLAEAERVMQRAVVLQAGKILMQGSIGAIKQELSQEILLELWLKNLTELPEAICVRLQGRVEQIRSGHYRVYLPKAAAQETITMLLRDLGFDELEDFRIAPPSLEELYHEMGQNA